MIDKIASDLFVLVPARKGSKRLPNKNKLVVGNRSLLCRTVDVIKKIGLMHHTFVSTDDDEIASEAIKLGLPVTDLRPSHLAQDHSSTIDVLRYVLEELQKKWRWSPKYVLLLQLTSPFRNSENIRYAISTIQTDERYPAIVSGKFGHIRNKKTIGLSADHLLTDHSEDNGKLVEADGNFYVARVEALLAGNTFLPNGTKVIISSKDQSIDIDTLEDFQLAEEKWRLADRIEKN